MIQLASTSGPHFANPALPPTMLSDSKRLAVKFKLPLLDARASMEQKPSPISATDWDALFRAIEARLVRIVNQPFALLPEPQIHTAAIRVREDVLECVEAMGQLHRELINEGRSRSSS